LDILGLTPAEFWASTPAETANLLIAHRRRENRQLRQRAWELHLLLMPHLREGSRLTAAQLFLDMPGSFPEPGDIEIVTASDPADNGLTEAQKKERERRRNHPRLQRPGKTG